MTETTLTTIVVSYNTEGLTLDCLASLAQEDCEVIVVDNASHDGSAASLQTWQRSLPDRHHLILNDENVGFARANNQGMKQARGRYVLLLNSDTVVQTGQLGQLVAWMDAHPDVGASGPRLVYPDGTPQPSPSPVPTAWMYVVRFLGLKHLLPSPVLKRWVARLLRPLLGKALVSHMDPGTDGASGSEIEYLSGAALLVRKEVIEQVGGLDDGYFMYLEDVDWCIRIRRAGWKLGFVPDVDILHYAGASFKGDRLKKSYRAANPESFKSIMRYLHTYFGAGSRLAVRTVITLSLAVQSLWTLPRLLGSDRAAAVAFIRGNLRNMAIVWQVRSVA